MRLGLAASQADGNRPAPDAVDEDRLVR